MSSKSPHELERWGRAGYRFAARGHVSVVCFFPIFAQHLALDMTLVQSSARSAMTSPICLLPYSGLVRSISSSVVLFLHRAEL